MLFERGYRRLRRDEVFFCWDGGIPSVVERVKRKKERNATKFVGLEGNFFVDGTAFGDGTGCFFIGLVKSAAAAATTTATTPSVADYHFGWLAGSQRPWRFFSACEGKRRYTTQTREDTARSARELSWAQTESSHIRNLIGAGDVSVRPGLRSAAQGNKSPPSS